MPGAGTCPAPCASCQSADRHPLRAFSFALLSLLVVWRCAANTGLQLWAWLARLVVSLYLLWAASKVPPLFL